MMWQYRTIVFEFAKDGLLGERYIDDEEMEHTLNEQGSMGWELVSAVMVQDGVLAVLKRAGTKVAAQKSHTTAVQEPHEVGTISAVQQQAITTEQVREQELEHLQSLGERQDKQSEEQGYNHVGDIKIS
ncbi:hypothetical protein [Desulfogranum marinum]|uniref:hypothetical protein n=1 Tax=Desulfogranum marinum TaxID=453220 RepID=UPI001962B2F5|nr:hypothetical protein [Desulfogranum marinum]MBM9513136.1 hypothetical protein [Desulfogranum marinum]